MIFLAVSLMMLGGVSVASAQNSTADATETKSTIKIDGEPNQKSLYEKLGGYDAISAVVEKFADSLFADPKINASFKGMGTDTRKQFKQKNKNLICNVTGGPCKILSRTAKETHAGLGITEDDFNVVAGHLVDVLNEFKVPKAEQKELIDIILTLKPDIVEKKKYILEIKHLDKLQLAILRSKKMTTSVSTQTETNLPKIIALKVEMMKQGKLLSPPTSILQKMRKR